jgi:arabinogalactan endo-1,4-beta-galactosidase
MRWLRLLGILFFLAILFLLGAFYTFRAVARKHARELGTRIATVPDPAANTPYPKFFFQRGVNFTAEFPAFYGNDAAVEMLKKLPAHGINSIALVPYGFASTKEPKVRGWNTRWEGDAGVTQLARIAHSLGMKVLLKPQLWMHGGNPADINFPGAAENSEWFAQYQPFLEHYAQLASAVHADVFCIGVELEKMSGNEQAWRKLIARARGIYPGPLTYAANFGAEFESIKFWDALDYIGIDEYYPLPDDLSTAAVVGKISAVQSHYQKPVLFTEAGFSSVAEANRAPWDEPPGPVDLEIQAKSYDALLSAFYEKPWFAGVYWWKVGTNGYGGPSDASHTPWNKPAMQSIEHWYRSGKR